MYKIAIAAPPERVWDTLTTPEGSKATLFGSTIESSFEVGEPVEYISYGEGGERIVQVYGQIEAFEVPSLFSYVQHPGPIHNPAHAQTSCRMTYRVRPAPGGSELELVIDEWTPGNPAYDHAADSYPESAYLDGVKSYAESR